MGKRDTENTDLFIRDLRERVIGQPEISTDGFLPYLPAIRDAFGKGAVHGQIIKTYSVVDLRPQASIRYSPCEVVAVEREVVSGLPMQISTSHIERRGARHCGSGLDAWQPARRPRSQRSRLTR